MSISLICSHACRQVHYIDRTTHTLIIVVVLDSRESYGGARGKTPTTVEAMRSNDNNDNNDDGNEDGDSAACTWLR